MAVDYSIYAVPQASPPLIVYLIIVRRLGRRRSWLATQFMLRANPPIVSHAVFCSTASPGNIGAQLRPGSTQTKSTFFFFGQKTHGRHGWWAERETTIGVRRTSSACQKIKGRGVAWRASIPVQPLSICIRVFIEPRGLRHSVCRPAAEAWSCARILAVGSTRE
jgi:hypothetical protein